MRDLLDRLAPDVDVDAAWEEVSARLGMPSRGRAPRILAVAAAVALVAGGAALAARATHGDDDAPASDALVRLDGGFVQYTDERLGVTVDFPEDWQHATVGNSVVVGTFPISDDPGPCGGDPGEYINDLGPTDVVVAVVRRTDELVDPNAGPQVDEFVLPTDPTSGESLIDCTRDLPDFMFENYSLGGGTRGADAVVFLGRDVDEDSRQEALAVLQRLEIVSSVRLEAPPDEESRTVSTVGPPDQIDAEGQAMIDEARAVWQLPPGASWGEVRNGFPLDMESLVDGFGYQAMCEWFRYTIDAVEQEDADQLEAALDGLQYLLEHEEIYGSGLRSDIFRAIQEAERGEVTTAQGQMGVNC